MQRGGLETLLRVWEVEVANETREAQSTAGIRRAFVQRSEAFRQQRPYVRFRAIAVIAVTEFDETLLSFKLAVHDSVLSPSPVPASSYSFDSAVLSFHLALPFHALTITFMSLPEAANINFSIGSE
jgi:hypothetical protein